MAKKIIITGLLVIGLGIVTLLCANNEMAIKISYLMILWGSFLSFIVGIEILKEEKEKPG